MVDRRRDDVVAAVRSWAPEGVARVVEVDLPANAETDAAVLAPGGVISSYASTGAAFVAPRELMTRNAVVEFVLVYTMPAPAKRAAVEAIEAALAAGALTSLPVTRFPLEQTAAALDAVRDGAVGKVLVDVG